LRAEENGVEAQLASVCQKYNGLKDLPAFKYSLTLSAKALYPARVLHFRASSMFLPLLMLSTLASNSSAKLSVWFIYGS
jgi:hypothetical protein